MRSVSELFRLLGGIQRHASRRTQHPDFRVRLSLNSVEVLEDRTAPSVSGVDLLTAGDYGVFGLQRTDITNQNGFIAGNVGVSQRGSVTNARGSTITGDVIEYALRQYSGRGALGGNVIRDAARVVQADQDALAASNVAAGLAATQTFRNISTPTTINGNGDINVINISGNITATLTLNGTAEDIFIVNVRGSVTLRGSESLALAGGVTASHVLYNFTGRNAAVSVRSGSVNGTLLGPRADFDLRGTIVNGEVIGGGGLISLTGGSHVNYVRFNGTNNVGNGGNVLTGSLSGRYWSDLNNNGTYDSGDAVGIGVHVILYQIVNSSAVFVADTFTDDTGAWTFDLAGLPAGTYAVTYEPFADGGSVVPSGTVNGNTDGTVQDVTTITGIVLSGTSDGVGYDYTWVSAGA